MDLIGITPTYHKGWIRMAGMSPSSDKWKMIWQQYFKSKKIKAILDMTHISIELYLPVFALMTLGRIDYFINPTNSLNETYIPTIDEIGSGALQTNQDIVESMEMTLNALLTNRSSYTTDKCNGFVANTTLPLATYVNVIASGSLSLWIDYCKAIGFSKQVSSYQTAIFNLIKGEIPDIEYIIKDIKYG